jgi:hypothetical protein
MQESSLGPRRPTKTVKLSTLAYLVGIGLALVLTSCGDDESIFVGQRLEQRCNASIPACHTHASCVLTNDSYYSGQFPGGLKTLVRTETEDATLVVRFLLTDMVFPGTELQIMAQTPSCDTFDEVHEKDVDLFELAGEDRTFEYEMDLEGRGDHLVEIFSDMSASYLMTLTVEE